MSEIRRLFVANRGEIAVRIVHAARKLGIQSVVGYSEADRGSVPTRIADQAVCIGRASAQESYLNIERVVSAAVATRCDAVHPGYGFLAESAPFVEACHAAGLQYVGPRPAVMRMMGDKSAARSAAANAGIPVLSGSSAVNSLEVLQPKELQFPILLKAVAGGGGKGIRRVDSASELEESFGAGQREARAAFGDSRLYVERLIPRARHIEVQILRDEYGNGIHLDTRECSVQRRHQKMLEEAPAGLPDSARRTMCEYALRLADQVDYTGVGTVEFILDVDTGDVYFIEMNTRLQVEHGVTELISGVDIVAEQIRIASGAPLAFAQDDVVFEGHAIEWRVTAESLKNRLMPNPGTIAEWVVPNLPHVRIDTHCFPNYAVPPFYDSLMAKLIAFGRSRDEAIARLRRAVDQFVITGIDTSLDLCRYVLEEPVFRAGGVTTDWLDLVVRELISEVASNG